MAQVKADRCEKHGRWRFNGVCLSCRNEVASALARDKVAELREMPPSHPSGEGWGPSFAVPKSK